jgi:hypothetical protein
VSGHPMSPETRAKMSAAHRGMKASPEARLKSSISHRGHVHSAETRMKMSLAGKGKPGCPLSPETRAKLSAALRGRYLTPATPEIKAKISAAKMGHATSEDTRAKIGATSKGRIVSPETRRKISEAELGEKHHNWRGGASFEPYCPQFNENLKERIRSYFDYHCVLCGKSTEENARKLSCHHVEYNKNSCCDGKLVQFAALCVSCHTKTTIGDRARWECVLHRVIDEIYGGRSYFTKDEWVQIDQLNAELAIYREDQ